MPAPAMLDRSCGYHGELASPHILSAARLCFVTSCTFSLLDTVGHLAVHGMDLCNLKRLMILAEMSGNSGFRVCSVLDGGVGHAFVS